MEKMTWNSQLYDQKHAFVFQYGESLLDLLQPKKGERILDLGCGTGHLAHKINGAGAEVIGLDSSIHMIEQAREAYPELSFIHQDARNFAIAKPFDAIFSNATLHWISDQPLVARTIYQHLKTNGRMVVEFGGKGNNAGMLKALRKVLAKTGHIQHSWIDFWYFPSVGEYTSLLEKAGFRVTYATHYDRPTLLEGPDGVKNWFKMFGTPFFEGIPEEEIERILNMTQDELRSTHLREGNWYADYKRIRVIAVREH